MSWRRRVAVGVSAVSAALRLDSRRRAEALLMEMTRVSRAGASDAARQRVLLLVDSVGLAELEALRYAKGLRSDRLIAVHFVIDESHAARLQVRWPTLGRGIELRVVDCEDRNLSRAASELVGQVKRDYPDSAVTVLLPRRMYSPLVGRLLHDRTADAMARVVSRIPDASAQILVCDVKSRIARANRSATEKTPARLPSSSRKPQATTPVN